MMSNLKDRMIYRDSSSRERRNPSIEQISRLRETLNAKEM